MIVKQLLERCTLWQVHLSKMEPKPSWKMNHTFLLDILKDRHVLLTGKIFLKSNGVWSQSRNIKSYSGTLKPLIASSADTLLRNGASKDNDGRGKPLIRKLRKMSFSFYSLQNLFLIHSCVVWRTECWVNVWNPWVKYFKSQLQREHLAQLATFCVAHNPLMISFESLFFNHKSFHLTIFIL